MDYPEERTAEISLRFNGLWISLLIIFLAGCEKNDTLPYYDAADFTPLWDIHTLKHPIHTIAKFSFTNQDNQLIANETFDGKVYVANFFFTSCPGICPKMTNNLKWVAEQFKDNKEVLFLSHSVTPWIDSVEQLEKFAKEYNIQSSQWHLITGRQEEINTMARKSYFAEQEPGLNKDSTEFLHTEHCLLIDRQRRIRGIYNGTLPLEMERLAEDIKILIHD